MQFIQVIEYRTSRFDEMQALGREWEAAAQSRTKARRRVLVHDRDDANHYLNIVFFDSYEEAMENSNDPVTQQFAGKLMALVDGRADVSQSRCHRIGRVLRLTLCNTGSTRRDLHPQGSEISKGGSNDRRHD